MRSFFVVASRHWLMQPLSSIQVVTEGPGEEISVRNLNEEEKVARAARHLAALKALGKPLEVVEAELSKLSERVSSEFEAIRHPDGPPTSKDKGKGTPGKSPEAPTSPAAPSSPRPSPTTATASKSPGLALTRTERIADDDDEPTPSPSTSQPPRPPPPTHTNSRVRAMTTRLFGRSSSTSRSPSPSRSIRFAEADRPAREGVREGRAMPVVGASLAIRRVPTVPGERDIRFAEGAKKEAR